MLKMHRGIDGMFAFSSGLCSWINKDSRICSRRQLLSLPMTSGLWKSTRWSGLTCKCLHTAELSDVRCSSIRFIKIVNRKINLSPRFLQFKLYGSNLQEARCVHSFRRFLLTKELNRRRQLLVAASNFEKEQRLVLFKQVGRLVSGPVEKFLLARRN